MTVYRSAQPYVPYITLVLTGMRFAYASASLPPLISLDFLLQRALYFSMKICRFMVIFFMEKISTSEKLRRVAEMRDKLAEYAASNNPKAQRIRAADIALRLLHPERYQLDGKQYNALVGRARRFLVTIGGGLSQKPASPTHVPAY